MTTRKFSRQIKRGLLAALLGALAGHALARLFAFLTVPNVTAGQQILASDVNTHITQTNTNTTNIATINSTITGYNNVPKDSALSSSGGVLQCNAISPTSGQITRIAFGAASATTGGASVSHGLGATPTAIIVTADNSSSSVNVVASGAGSSSFTVTSSINTTVWWLAIA